MKPKTFALIALLALLMLMTVSTGSALAQGPQPTKVPTSPGPLQTSPGDKPRLPMVGGTGFGFTYQGANLKLNGNLYTGTCDLDFRLYSASTGGIPLTHVVVSSSPVMSGLFSAVVDLGSVYLGSQFNGDPRYLEVGFSCPHSASPTYTYLPRQRIWSVPYAAGLVPGLQVDSSTWSGGDIFGVVSRNTGDAVNGYSYGSGRAGYFRISNSANSVPALYAETDGIGPALYAYNYSGRAGVFIGKVGIGTSDPGSHELHVVGNGFFDFGITGSVNIGTPQGMPGLIATATNGNRRDIFFTNDAIILSTSASPSTAGPGNGLAIWPTYATLKGNLKIASASTGATVVELGEGLDYAEGFLVSDKTNITPGSVLVIDADDPGKLALSRVSYDRKVAGIVAGANGLGSAVRLGAGQFDFDVALSGRVYCKVDATNQSVEPGDLLTTSETPGYAMKVSDYLRSQGAILGKAMERMPKGEKGLILVLVTLQ